MSENELKKASPSEQRVAPGPRDHILDLFGSFVRDYGGWVAVADLLALLGSLGVAETSGRSALSRMKRQGEIEAISRGSVRGYALTPGSEEWFADGTERIMKGSPWRPDDLWVLAAFTVPEDERKVRYQIRARLRDLGFGQLSGGLMIAPASILDETVRALERAELVDYIDLWQSQHIGFMQMERVVASAWDLPMIDHAYRDYLASAAALEAGAAPADDEAAFVRYVHHVHAWRELPFIDPGIPDRYVPGDWRATEARETFGRISNDLRPGAWRHFVTVATTDE